MKVKRILALTLCLVYLASCTESIIEIKPEAAVTRELALKNVNGINAAVLSAYRRMHEFAYYGQQQILNAEALGDNLEIANNTGRYTGQVVNAVGSHFGTWSTAPWRIINDVNIVLKYVDAAAPLVGQTSAQAQPARDRYKGEAYFLRAFAYHDLAKVYGYEPGREVNGFNLSVMLRTEPVEGVSGADKRARNTNVEVYQQIESDLLNAITFLPEESALPAGDRYLRASKAAARALLARVYLYWGRYADAATRATEALTPTSTSKTLTTAAGFDASWSATIHPESLLELDVRQADWSTVDGVNNSMASITNSLPTGQNAGSAQFAVQGSDELIAAHEAGDVRLALWVNNAGRNESKKWRGEKLNYIENIPLIRVAEVVLTQAEGLARSGNEPGARTAINSLRTNRGLAATAASGQALLDLIMNERRVELAFEGHRFFDLKRLGMNIDKPAALGVNDVPYTDYRILANIPSAEVTYNELLQQNPNY